MQKSKEMKVFPADGGFRIVRRESRERALQMVAVGALREEFDQANGALIGFRIVGVEMQRVDSDLRSMRTAVSISPSEMEMNAGLRGRSRTFGLPERMRLERAGRGELPEDQVERVQAKVRVYVHVTAVKGDILRVWPR